MFWFIYWLVIYFAFGALVILPIMLAVFPGDFFIALGICTFFWFPLLIRLGAGKVVDIFKYPRVKRFNISPYHRMIVIINDNAEYEISCSEFGIVKWERIR